MQIFTQESETTSWGTFQDFDKSMSLSKLNAMRSIKSNEIVYLFGDPDTQERIKEDMKNYKDPFNLLFEELNKLIKNN